MKKSLLLVLLIIVSIVTMSLVACNQETDQIVIGTPDGAPALAFANLLGQEQDYKTKATVSIDIVAGSDAAVLVGGKILNDEFDVAVLPSNVAANLYNGNVELCVLGTVTWGNLYLINKTGAMTDLSALEGKTVHSISMSGIPYQMFKYLLSLNNLSIATEDDVASGDLTSKVIVKGATAPQIIGTWDTGVEYAIVAEPALTNILAKKATAKIGYDFQAAYAQSVEGEVDGYPQAVLVAKRTFVKNNSRFIKDLLKKLEQNKTYLTVEENVTAAVEAAKVINEGTALASVKKVVTAERCNVNFVRAEDCKTVVTDFLTTLGVTVDDNFFYEV